LLNNRLTQRALAVELDAGLKGAVISAVFTQEKDELVLLFEPPGSPAALHFSAKPSFIFLSPLHDFARARKNSVDLFERCRGCAVISAKVATNDRIIRFSLDNGDSLLFILFAGEAGAILQSPDGEPLEVFKRARPHTDAVFDNTPPDPDVDAARRLLDMPGDEAVSRVLGRICPFISGVFADELLHRAGVPKNAAASSLGLDEKIRIVDILKGLIRESAACKPRIYSRAGVPLHLSLVELTHFGSEGVENFEEIGDAVFTFTRRRLSHGGLASAKSRILDAIDRELHRARKSEGHLRSPEDIVKQAAEYEKFGNLLMINLNAYPEQPWRITLPDIFVDPRLVLSIPLREGESLLDNAQRYYDKARAARASVARVRERAAYLQSRTEELTALAAGVDAAPTIRALKEILDGHNKLLASMGLTAKGEKEEKPFPFRRFTVAGGYEVWVGRNSASNDELTTRHARPNDLWFHVRGAGGSHVVLRCHGSSQPVPKEAVRAAAAIAAYYSKQRNAGSTPVAYAEKKHVRKPRGAPPGTVQMEREKVISVKPGLPEPKGAAERNDEDSDG